MNLPQFVNTSNLNTYKQNPFGVFEIDEDTYKTLVNLKMCYFDVMEDNARTGWRIIADGEVEAKNGGMRLYIDKFYNANEEFKRNVKKMEPLEALKQAIHIISKKTNSKIDW